jgi:serine protease inhibitor
MGAKMRNAITPENLHNLQLMFLSATIIHPVWASPFDRITKGIFYGEANDTKCNYLHSIGKSYGYFEDNAHQLLEIRCNGNNVVMGFLLHKNNIVADVDDLKLHFFISHMKESVLDEVKIPMFTQDIKLRFNSTLKNMGLNSVFIKIISPEFFPENVVLQDIVQNIKIVVDDTAVKSQENNRGYRTIRKFIAEKPFIYYFRLVKTDTILLIGTYQ